MCKIQRKRACADTRIPNVYFICASSLCVIFFSFAIQKEIHALHTERQHKCSNRKKQRRREKKMRIEKRSKKRTEIACNDRTNAPDVYNYLCIAESEHIHLLCFSFVSILFSTARLFSLSLLLLSITGSFMFNSFPATIL